MWGDFSILRRIFDDYDPGSNYGGLSIADKSTIHTAACTMGMLAHNIKTVTDEYDNLPGSGAASVNAVGVQIANMMDGSSSNGEIGTDPITNLCTGAAGSSGCPPATYDPNYYAQFTPEQWINALENSGALGANLGTAVGRSQTISRMQQIQRDRTLGFLPAGTEVGTPGSGAGYSASTGTLVYQGSGGVFAGETFKVGCDPTIFDTTFGVNSEKSQLGLAAAFCSIAQGPKYPSLYYLFPVVDHGQEGTGYHAQPTASEEFFTEGGTYINSVNTGSDKYKAVAVADIALTPRDPLATDASGWKLPKVDVTPASNPGGDFNFPEASTQGILYTDSAVNVPLDRGKNLSQNMIRVRDGSTDKFYRTALLEKGMMDGRELLNNRVMDLDINLLTANKIGGKAWIPEDTGIVYAFREDAVREDAIVRPYSNSFSTGADAWATCKDFTELTTNANCYMFLDPSPTDDSGTPLVNESTFRPHDPPLNSATGISPKPVDMYADPSRRPYGFRLINGESLNRTATDSSERVAGMTFVSDNTVYIRGDFNLHADKSGSGDLEDNLIEEFDEKLGTTFADKPANKEQEARELFYGRKNLNAAFADPSKDNWRPVEIFADGITILSDRYIDGWIEHGFTMRSTTNRGKPRIISSYLNFNRPWFDDSKWDVSDSDSSDSKNGRPATYARARWEHENPNDDSTPIKIDRNGNVYRQLPSGTGAYLRFPDQSGGSYLSFYRRANSDKAKTWDKTKAENGGFYFALRQSQQNGIKNDPVRVNALLIGGIIPSRAGQNYGGLHNFPRLLEFWAPDGKLVISGGFFQLNFSSQAVAQFDQDSWEPGMPAQSGSNTQNQIVDASGVKTGSQKFNGFFYGAADRVWGYDVGFQYTPAGPISRRFVRLDRPRSEFYRELPIDDPYIKQLCDANIPGVDC
ncbi:MAG: hypothetical protein ABG776_05485 [Cyanobacteria bacterium J06555_13]